MRDGPLRDIIHIDTRPLWWLERRPVGHTLQDFVCARNGAQEPVRPTLAFLLQLFFEQPEIDGCHTISGETLAAIFKKQAVATNVMEVTSSLLRTVLKDSKLPIELAPRRSRHKNGIPGPLVMQRKPGWSA